MFHLGPPAGLIVIACTGMALAGCGVIKGLEDHNSYTVTADPLFVSVGEIACAVEGGNCDSPNSVGSYESSRRVPSKYTAILNGGIDQKKQFLGVVLLDSEQKCGKFLNRLAVAQSGVNATGDILTTVLSGVATTVAPLSLSHGFSAASTIVGGTKAALNQDLWAKAGIEDFERALATSYYAKVESYTFCLGQKTDINIPIELQKIQSIHHFCSLSAARDVISTTLSSAALSSAAPPAASQSTTVCPDTSVAVPGQNLQTYILEAQQHRSVAFKPDQTSERIFQWLYPTMKSRDPHGAPLNAAGTPAVADQGKLNTLHAWLKLHGDYPTAIFLNDASLAALRSQAITSLHVP